MRPKLLAFTSVLLLALVAASAALAENGGIAPPGPQSPNAGRIADIYWVLLGITGAIFLLVEGALILFIVRYRNRGRPRDAEGPQIRGHNRLEIAWTVVPVLILAAITAFVFYKLPGIKNVPTARAGSELDIYVAGHQYYWQFRYPNGVIAVNRMRAPAGRVVTLDITAPDVIHSWWIPELHGKFDAVPGETNSTWFKAARPGVYKGQCGEFCGLQHATMVARVEVLPAAEFDRWLARAGREQAQGTSQLGRETYRGACANCHGFGGGGGIGPRIAGNPLLNDDEGIRTLLRQGRNEMPPVGATWSDRQMDATVRYLRRRFAPDQPGGNGG